MPGEHEGDGILTDASLATVRELLGSAGGVVPIPDFTDERSQESDRPLDASVERGVPPARSK